jgi:uncharacterized protein (DUF58 family)
MAEFHYRVRWRSSSARPGHHRSVQSGGGYEFSGHAPLISNPDPRHLDIRASLHDPLGQLMVRTFRQRSTIPVFVIADLSASMGFCGAANKMDILADFVASVAYSAYRTGDPFGFIGCDSSIRSELYLPLRWHKAVAQDLWTRLRNFVPQGKSSAGLCEVLPRLGNQRTLVFLISDFHFALRQLDDLLGSMHHHDVVPVVLWDSAEYERLPTWGLFYLEDPETGERRRLLMRPRLREKFRAVFARRREELIQVCTQHRRKPFFIADRFDSDELTRYFLES